MEIHQSHPTLRARPSIPSDKIIMIERAYGPHSPFRTQSDDSHILLPSTLLHTAFSQLHINNIEHTAGASDLDTLHQLKTIILNEDEPIDALVKWKVKCTAEDSLTSSSSTRFFKPYSVSQTIHELWKIHQRIPIKRSLSTDDGSRRSPIKHLYLEQEASVSSP